MVLFYFHCIKTGNYKPFTAMQEKYHHYREFTIPSKYILGFNALEKIMHIFFLLLDFSFFRCQLQTHNVVPHQTQVRCEPYNHPSVISHNALFISPPLLLCINSFLTIPSPLWYYSNLKMQFRDEPSVARHKSLFKISLGAEFKSHAPHRC